MSGAAGIGRVGRPGGEHPGELAECGTGPDADLGEELVACSLPDGGLDAAGAGAGYRPIPVGSSASECIEHDGKQRTKLGRSECTPGQRARGLSDERLWMVTDEGTVLCNEVSLTRYVAT